MKFFTQTDALKTYFFLHVYRMVPLTRDGPWDSRNLRMSDEAPIRVLLLHGALHRMFTQQQQLKHCLVLWCSSSTHHGKSPGGFHPVYQSSDGPDQLRYQME
jgi:hypothetical protein